nr:EOG090X083V [Eurycercus lamellatus]
MSNLKGVYSVNVIKSKDEENLGSLSKEELIERIKKLNCHVVQLRNLLKTEQATKCGKDHKRRPFDYKKYAKRHVFLHLAYTGWDYSGFVVQEHTEKTIEAELFKALEKLCLIEDRQNSNYHRCGRTDKGVSSFGQVISIDFRSNLCEGKGVFIPEGHQIKSTTKDIKEEIRYVHLLNKVLPNGIRALAWAPVEASLSSRFDCKHRIYHYYFPKSTLDIEKMKIASQSLIGEHDFRNFCKMDVGNGVVQFHRRIIEIKIEALDGGEDGYSMYRLKLIGQAFLWHQVRCIVAILFLVGQKKEEPSIIQELLDVENNPRKPQYGMASELPLNLFTCSYSETDCEWIYDSEALRFAINDYQTLWTENNVKATMLKEMLNYLEGLVEFKVENQAKSLVLGVESKTYVPLMKRPTCDSLEERVEHYAKRKRIEVIEELPRTADNAK